MILFYLIFLFVYKFAYSLIKNGNVPIKVNVSRLFSIPNSSEKSSLKSKIASKFILSTDSENVSTPKDKLFPYFSSNQMHLKWTEPPKRVLFLTKQYNNIPDPEIFEKQKEAIRHLIKKDLDILVEASIYDHLLKDKFPMKNIEILTQESKNGIDFVITFGGDGLLMYCNQLFGSDEIPPIMCFDFGSLGFLAPFSYHQFIEEIEKIFTQSFPLTLRMRLICDVYKNTGDLVSSYIVLNEVVIDRGPSPFLSNVDICCDAQYLTTVQGDGVIIATPTGSTAYSLAAGGSMVHPSVPAILLTPICAHTLSFRPLVLPHTAVLSCVVPEDVRANGWISFDGKFRQELEKGDSVSIRLCPNSMPTMNRLSFTADWFEALRSRFMFNQRPKQKALPSDGSITQNKQY